MTAILISHALIATALLGALTHQAVALFVRPKPAGDSFVARYARVPDVRFRGAVIALYLGVLVLGSVIYPAYRVDVRIPFEELGLRWAVGMFEIKEHAAGIGLGALPLYAYVWRADAPPGRLLERRMITAFFATVVWYDFLAGHILNNIRGLA